VKVNNHEVLKKIKEEKKKDMEGIDA